jgi:hypothetical protein
MARITQSPTFAPDGEGLKYSNALEIFSSPILNL